MSEKQDNEQEEESSPSMEYLPRGIGHGSVCQDGEGRKSGQTPPNVERETGEKREWFPTIGAPIPTTSSLWVRLWQYLIKGVTDGVVGLDSLLARIFAEPSTPCCICRKLYRWFVYHVVDPACGTGGFFLAGKGLSRSFPGTMIFPLMGGERWRSVLVLRCLQRGFDR